MFLGMVSVALVTNLCTMATFLAIFVALVTKIVTKATLVNREASKLFGPCLLVMPGFRPGISCVSTLWIPGQAGDDERCGRG